MLNGPTETRLQEARQSSTQTRRPEIPEQEEQEEISPQEALIRAAERGEIDLGEQEEEITPQQALNRARVSEAKEALPRIQEQEELEDIPMLQSAANSFMRGLTEYLPAAMQTETVLKTELANLFRSEEEDIDPRLLPQYQAGQELGSQLSEIFPENPEYRDDFWAGTVAKAAGNMVPQVALAVGTAGLGTGATVAAQSGLTATLGSQFYNQAREEGASNEEAFSQTLLNMAGVAGLEAIPMARFARRVDDVTGGGWKKILQNGFSGSIEEGTTEALQQFYENASAQIVYDSTRDLMDGVYESFGAGAVLGSAVNSTMPALMNKFRNAETSQERAELAAALEETAQAAEALPGETPMTRNDVNEFLNKYTDQETPSPEPVVEGESGAGVTNSETNLKSQVYKKSREKWNNFWTKWLRPGGVKGKEITVREEKMNALIDSQMEEAYLNFSRLNRAVLDNYDSDKNSIYDAINDAEDTVPAEIMTQIDQVFRNQAEVTSLPESIREPVQRTRKHIDRLSMEMVKSGLVQGDLKTTFIKNIGAYVHRDYKAFDQEVEWNEQIIPDDVWNSAVAYMRNSRMKAYRDVVGEAPGQQELSKIRLEAEKDVRKILNSANISSVNRLFQNKRVTENRANRDVLMERQDVPKPIRDVLGEYKDPAVNYINTINEMSQLIEKRRYFDDIADLGRGSLFFTEDEMANPEFEGNAQDYVQGLNDNTGSRLSSRPDKTINGDRPPKLYMHKQLNDALTFEAGNNDIPGWLSPLIRVNSLAKYSKTVLSHVAHARNVMGGLGFLNTNGLFFTKFSDVKSAWSKATTVFRSYENMNEKDLGKQWTGYVNLGLSGGSIRAGELLDLMEDVDYDSGSFMDNFNHNKATAAGQGLYNKSKSWFKKYSRKLTNLYKLEDAFIRTFMFELEKSQLQNADPSITDQEVADIVNDQYPNYNRLNETLKLARRFPAIAPFISFPAEVVRTQVNTVKRALVEIESDKPAMRKVGYRRLAGTIVNSAGVMGAGAASQAMMRMDDEEEQAIRHFLPPWDRNSIIAYLDSSRGKVRYINTSYTNPHEFLLDPLFALISGDSDRDIIDRFGDSMGELFSPILSEELAFKAIRELRSNQTADGSEIWNPEDQLADKLQKGFLHFWDAVEPGSISSAERFFEPLVEEESKKNVGDEIFGLFGLRISTVDISRSFGFRIRDFRQRIRDSKRVYNSVKYRKGASSSEKREALQRANSRYEEIFTEMRQITDAAQESGVRWGELEEIMKDSGLASRDINGLRSGTWEPFEP